MAVVSANYFDGRSTRVRSVSLAVEDGELVVTGEDVDLRIPFGRVKVDERLGTAPRRLRFPDGTFCEVRDLAALDLVLSSTTHRDGWVDLTQRRLTSVLLACVACLALTVVVYKVGLPWAAEYGARRLPPAVGKALSLQALRALDGHVLLPSKLDAGRQQALTSKFHSLRLQEGGNPKSPLLFRQSPQLGANAFTLPDGTIVMLDGLVTSIDDDRQILAVLSHELGHAHGNHGLQLLLRSSAVGAFLTLYIGDISHLLAAAPAALLEAHYSQDLEREADDYGATLLSANGMSPGLLADVLTTLTASHPESSRTGYLSTHPSTQERIRHLRSLATAPAVR